MDQEHQSGVEVLCIGELLADLISTDYVENLDEEVTFKRVVGGSPANVANNLARLGHRVGLVSTVGDDGTGQVLLDFVQKAGIRSEGVHLSEVPSTMILVTKSKEVPSFELYRYADPHIHTSQIPSDWLPALEIYHTTCFGLSMEPAQSTILSYAEAAKAVGVQLSIDVNYAPRVWPNREQAQQVVERYVGQSAFVKVSEVDWERLYGQPVSSPHEVMDHFLKMGANLVCLTLGGEGAWAANGKERQYLESRRVDVVDTTGAGDAFWSGFLSATLDNLELKDRLLRARAMAELKIGQLGPIKKSMDRWSLTHI